MVVSTLAEAEFLADGGFDDILYAVPLSPDKLPHALALNEKLDAFHVLLDHEVQVAALIDGIPDGSKPLSVYVAVDCGYHRDGVDPEDEASVELIKRLDGAATTIFAGIYTHAGHSYDAPDADAVRRIAEQERQVTVGFAAKLRRAGLRVASVGVGSTPTCSLPPADLEGVDEMHPGNYLYYDITQVSLGACSVEDVAVRVLTRVVGHYPKSNTLLIDCGWTGASAQGKELGYGGFPDHPELRIRAFKQECGEVTSADGSPIDYHRFPIGTVLAIAPYHSCAATQQHRVVHLLEDDRKTISDSWTICKGW